MSRVRPPLTGARAAWGVCATGLVLGLAAVAFHSAAEHAWEFLALGGLLSLLVIAEYRTAKASSGPVEDQFSPSVVDWSEGGHGDIAREISRCRRHAIPLTLMVVRPVAGLTGRHGHLAKLCRLVQQGCRRTDIVVVDRRLGRLLIVAPHAGMAASRQALQRIGASLQRSLGVGVEAGIAEFGTDAVTWQALIACAESRCRPITPGGSDDRPVVPEEAASTPEGSVPS